MRVVSYNLWHGLNGSGVWSFGELEPPGRRQQREEWQIRQLALLDADLLLLQEVNPLRSRAPLLGQRLARTWVSQVDQGGLRIGTQGVPRNFQNGMMILAHPNLRLKERGGLRLSGHPFGFCSHWASLQFSEFRYLLAGEISWKDRRVLVVNSHLHHGRALHQRERKEIDEVVQTGSLTPDEAQRLRQAMEEARQRRFREVQRALEWIESQAGYDGVLWGGDFNCEVSHGELDALFRAGFEEITSGVGPTWDSEGNLENHEITLGMKVPLPDFGKPEVGRMISRWDLRSEKIDLLFCKGEIFQGRSKARRILDKPVGGLIGSDHFGVLCEWS